MEDDEGFLKFSTEAHRQFYYRALYPGRADRDPDSLFAFVFSCIQLLDRQVLRSRVSDLSRVPFPKEAVFQQLLFRIAPRLLPSTREIFCEVSKIITGKRRIHGSLFCFLRTASSIRSITF